MHNRFLILLFGLLLARAAAADSLLFEAEEFGLPGQGQMEAFDINNNNDIVGRVDIVDPSAGSPKPTGYVRSNGNIVLIDVPGSGPLNGTQAYGINDAGQIVGKFVVENGANDSFGFEFSNGVITPVDVPGADDTEAYDINNADTIVGRAFLPPQTGFALGSAFTLEAGNYSTFQPDGVRPSFGIAFYGINDHGNVVGRVFDETGFRAFAIIDGVYLPFVIPGDRFGGTTAWGINNQNQIVGTFKSDAIVNRGFLMDTTGIYQIDIPGAATFGSNLYGLNDSGSLVGSIDASGFPTRKPVAIFPCGATSATCFEAPRIGDPVIDFPPAITEINIDIKPRRDRNRINPNSRRLVRVAILGSPEFDALQANPETLTFGPGEASAEGNSRARDINHDGYPDLILRFRIPDTGITCGDVEATLAGESYSGDSFTGTDSIVTIGCRKSLADSGS